MRTWLFTALLLLIACVRPSKVVGVACDDAADCALASVTGKCESTGYCSYPDDACTGGQRYTPGAGDGLGGVCVGGASTCGGMDQPCCGNLCAANLACDATSMTCSCGDDGEPCCGGNVCNANITCGDNGICACGDFGEPCCGGTTCDSGASCTAGTCVAGATQIAIGAGHACALRPDRSVWCWGNDWKPWATQTPGLLATTIASAVPKRIPGLTDVAEIRAAEMHTCARKMDGTLWCWGHNESGQLGNGANTSSPVPVQVTGLSGVTLFDGGRHHTCALGTYSGTQGLWCWGRNGRNNKANATGAFDQTMSRLGNNAFTDSAVPVAVDLSVATGAGQTVRALSTGNYYSCVALSDNTVWCWGKNANGQLGNGTTTSSKVPVQVNLGGVTLPGGATIDEVSCSDGSGFKTGSACMRLSNGAVYCWGAASQLGDGSTVQRTAPTAAVTMTALGSATFTKLGSAAEVHCGLSTVGDVWCWGSNKNGVLGINDGTTTTARTTPVKALMLTGATQLDMSHRSVCAIDGQQQLWCWGANRRGLIIGAQPRVLQPTKVPL
jgi:alpha-tubulin suppressor-like RCC1 family protein